MTAAVSPLATPSATRAVLERHGFDLKKSFGQNFLINDAIVAKIIELSGLAEDDVVLEVGPGIGTLTYALLANSRAVIAIERDPALPAVLADTLSQFADKLAVIEKDALDVGAHDIEETAGSIGMDQPTKFISNLPYAVAATVVLQYFQELEALQSATVMVQKEVAERMMARPGTKNYGAYTVKLSLYAESAGSFDVNPSNFMPAPHVESTVIRLNRIGFNASDGAVADDELDDARRKAAATMADAAFFARRKTIANSCKQYFASRNSEIAEKVLEILEAAGVDPRIRGEALTKQDYIRLGNALLKY